MSYTKPSMCVFICSFLYILGGGTATEKALKAARSSMFTLDSGARYGVSKVRCPVS